MKKRILSALVLIFITVLCFMFPFTRVLYFAVAGILCAIELSKNFELLDAACSLWVMVTYLFGAAILVLFGSGWFVLLAWSIAAVYMSLFAGVVQTKVSGKGAFYTMGGVCYPCMLFVTIMVICRTDLWLETMVLGITSSWVCDCFALIGGSRIGKHKLAPNVSPSKTVEGSICGAVSALVDGAVVFLIFHFTGVSDISLLLCVATAFLASSMGQIGDLAESLLKRMLGVKDFSNLIPGHGGMFDRFDSLLFSIPTSYFILRGIELLQ